MSSTTSTAAIRDELSVLAWRDYDPDACRVPGMELGEVRLTGGAGEEARRLWELGARQVQLPYAVDLAAAADDPRAAARAVRALCLVRDFTAQALVVRWRLRLPADGPDAWQPLNHLQPPLELTGPGDPAAALQTWRENHYLCKCLWRQGPGFLQIRDRRWGELRRFTVAEPGYPEAIAQLSDGAPCHALPPEILADFRAEQLVGQVGDLAWWLPYRVRRWIQEAMTV
ncbi:DUF5825 family protein [Streptomyces palmae]|uniref:Uncharacterized protein n=1 Tax=Streptomyces palmae TaxID=1701085 RepID=A0A4Z0HDX8_9ACTN|nr:DUF5825 family protein [Streptomyces palmae]TGB13661.1 hypothetical protein E4099_09605 [Streptomyces palmae]